LRPTSRHGSTIFGASRGDNEPNGLVAALRRGEYQTAIGTVSFDAKGDLKAPEWAFYEWRAGKYAPAAF
jgi:branched-chain amino acid transport system substrate-binding protein